jgi:hypothetical protein
MKVNTVIKIEGDADDWQLYHLSGRDEVAEALSNAASEAINHANERYNCGRGISTHRETFRDAHKQWYSVAKQYEYFGAADTEPCYVFLELLERYFVE